MSLWSEAVSEPAVSAAVAEAEAAAAAELARELGAIPDYSAGAYTRPLLS